MRDGDHKKFIGFVGVIEEGYRDLGRLSMERKITTTSSVSIIERRLLPSIRERWSELVCRKNTEVDRTNKFPHLLDFLLEKKRAIKYNLAYELAGPVWDWDIGVQAVRQSKCVQVVANITTNHFMQPTWQESAFTHLQWLPASAATVPARSN